MEYLVDREQMQAIDQHTIHSIGIPSFVLMERAALAVVSVIKKRMHKRDKILVVCGSGNNGGDGIAIGRILQEMRCFVTILFVGNYENASNETKCQLEIAKKMQVKILNNTEFGEYNIIIDAIFGIGLDREIKGPYKVLIDDINRSKKRIFSVDIPSGIHSGTGKVMGCAIKAHETITFGWNKIGMVLYPGSEYAGKITVKNIGFPDRALEIIGKNFFSYNKKDLGKLPKREAYSNKGSFGKVLIVAGSYNMSGACYFSAQAAYASGAGMVKIVTTQENRTILQQQLPEALLFTYENGKITKEEKIIEEIINWATVIVIGPGLGSSEDAKKMLHYVIEKAKVPVIIDADGINLLNEVFRKVLTTRKNRELVFNKEDNKLNFPRNFILTPHLKEMSRLWQKPVEIIIDDLLATIKEAVGISENATFTLALKDARTIVTNGKEIYINQSGNNGMATAGAGDVLTGIIAAFIAQGMENFQATCLGVYVHGLAGQYGVRKKGYYGLMARDIIEGLYEIWKKIQN